VKGSNLFYQDLSGYILIIEKYSDEWIGTIWVVFQFTIFFIKIKIEIHYNKNLLKLNMQTES
jgi:hypothetical protein